MKKQILLVLLLVVSYSYSQSVNDYKAVIIPLKYDFLKSENQYRLITLTKFNLIKAGFPAFYSNEIIPNEYNDRCSLLYVDVVKENTFLTTKLFITFKDCYDKIIFQSAVGKSKEKDFEVAYTAALNEAFQSIYDLQYKYNGATATKVQSPAAQPLANPVAANVVRDTIIMNAEVVDLLYAQPTATGFQFINKEPKVVMKVFRTSNKDCYIAVKGDIQGVLISKENQWYFEFYQNNTLISEKISVRF
ncbi:hypothetical protein [Flavobacterium caseinilyticum]|uniref:Uncharacterized protein n=1 Tax=Flavobacterium caseinilyticum TaxID=2541732 RepID=A0A4R5AXF1_9FLAO|nr:hypothetical protein [Flavobacterium caseinilyticum]TDD75874.1 hypothetical protein E0F89_09940 [Flavobacterium caseinilyticum]